jgi:hypothetical protein
MTDKTEQDERYEKMKTHCNFKEDCQNMLPLRKLHGAKL